MDQFHNSVSNQAICILYHIRIRCKHIFYSKIISIGLIYWCNLKCVFASGLFKQKLDLLDSQLEYNTHTHTLLHCSITPQPCMSDNLPSCLLADCPLGSPSEQAPSQLHRCTLKPHVSAYMTRQELVSNSAYRAPKRHRQAQTALQWSQCTGEFMTHHTSLVIHCALPPPLLPNSASYQVDQRGFMFG